MSLTIFSPGDIIKSAEHNDNFNDGFKLQGEKAINDVSATNSGVLAGSSQVLIDKFLVAAGQNNTVDTGNSDAYYAANNDYYVCDIILSTIISEPSFETVNDWTYSESASYFSGGQSTTWKTEGDYSYLLSLITSSNVTSRGTNQISQTVDLTNINYISFDWNGINDSVDINKTVKLRYKIGTSWVDLAVLEKGTSASGTKKVDVSSLTGNQEISFGIYVVHSGPNYNVKFYIDNIKSDFTDSTLQSVATTIPTGMTKVFVTPLMYEALATGDSITADVSIDNGSTYTTDIPINEWTNITSANGTSLIVKLNLLTGDGTTTPKVKGWRVLLE
jgi:hypothetical protein